MLRFGGHKIYTDAMGIGAGSTVSWPYMEQVLLDASGSQSPTFERQDGDLREMTSSKRTV